MPVLATKTPSVADTPTPAATATPDPDAAVTKLLFTGDIIPARCTHTRLRALDDFTAPFRELAPQLQSADITIGSLDTSLSTASAPHGCIETFNLASSPRVIEGLTYAGYDVITNATNHAADCGANDCGNAALLQTRETLKSGGVIPVGTGRNLTEAREPAIIERNGVKFAFLGYDDIANFNNATDDRPGTAPLDRRVLAEDAARTRALADVVIVLPHWGVEYTADPSLRQREIASIAAIAGIDAVVGNHPHWVQAQETMKDTYIAYSLGNFVFDQNWSLETQQGTMLELTFRGTELESSRFIPVHIYDDYQPRPAPPDEAAAILKRIEDASAALGEFP